jgi:hypothetical protein
VVTPPLRVTIARRQLDMTADDLAAMIRDTSASRAEDLPALYPVRFGSDGKPAAITAIVGCCTGGRISFNRAAGIAARIRSVLCTAADGLGWRVLAPLSAELPIARHGETLRRLEAVFGPIFIPQCRDPARSYRYGRLPGIDHRVIVTEGVPIERVRLPSELPWRVSKNGNPCLYFGDHHAVTCQTQDGWRYAIATAGSKGKPRWRKPVFSSISALKTAVVAELYRLGPAIDDSG